MATTGLLRSGGYRSAGYSQSLYRFTGNLAFTASRPISSVIHSKSHESFTSTPSRRGFGLHYKDRRRDIREELAKTVRVEDQPYHQFYDRKKSDWVFALPYGYKPVKTVCYELETAAWSTDMFDFYVDHYTWLTALHNFNFLRYHRAMKLFLFEWIRSSHTRGQCIVLSQKDLRDLDAMNRRITLNGFMQLLESEHDIRLGQYFPKMRKILKNQFLSKFGPLKEKRSIESNLTVEQAAEMHTFIANEMARIRSEIERDIMFKVANVIRVQDGKNVSDAIARDLKYFEFDFMEDDDDIRDTVKQMKAINVKYYGEPDYRSNMREMVSKFLEDTVHDSKSDANQSDIPKPLSEQIHEEDLFDFSFGPPQKEKHDLCKQHYASWRGIYGSLLTPIQKMMREIRQIWDFGERAEIEKIISREKFLKVNPMAREDSRQYVPGLFEWWTELLIDDFAQDIALCASNLHFETHGLQQCEDLDYKMDIFMEDILNTKDPVDLMGSVGTPKVPLDLVDAEFLHRLREHGIDSFAQLSSSIDLNRLDELLKSDLAKFVPDKLLEEASKRARHNAFQSVYNNFSDSLKQELRMNGVQPEDLDGATKKALKQVVENLRSDLLFEAQKSSKTSYAVGKYMLKLAHEELQSIGTKKQHLLKEDLLSSFIKSREGQREVDYVLKRLREKEDELKTSKDDEILNQIRIRLEFFEYALQKQLEDEIIAVVRQADSVSSPPSTKWDAKLDSDDPAVINDQMRRQNILLLQWLRKNIRYSLHSVRKLMPFVFDLYRETDRQAKLRAFKSKSAIHKVFLVHDIRFGPVCRAAYYRGPHQTFALLHGKNNYDDLEYALFDYGNTDYDLYRANKDIFDKSLVASMFEPEYLSNYVADAFGEHVYLDRYLLPKNMKTTIEARERKRHRFLDNPINQKHISLIEERMNLMKSWIEQTGGFDKFTHEMKEQIGSWAEEACKTASKKQALKYCKDHRIESLNNAVQLSFRRVGPLNVDDTGRFIREHFLKYARNVYDDFVPPSDNQFKMKERVRHLLFYGMSPDGYVPKSDHAREKWDREKPFQNEEDLIRFKRGMPKEAQDPRDENIADLHRRFRVQDEEYRKQDLWSDPKFVESLQRKLKTMDPWKANLFMDQFRMRPGELIDDFGMSDKLKEDRILHGKLLLDFHEEEFNEAGFCMVNLLGLKTPLSYISTVHHSQIELQFPRSEIDAFVDYFMKNGKLDESSSLFGKLTVKDVRRLSKVKILEDIKIRSEQTDVGSVEFSGSTDYLPKLDQVYLNMTTGRHSNHPLTENHSLLFDDADWKGQYTQNQLEVVEVHHDTDEVEEEWEWAPMTRQAFIIENNLGSLPAIREFFNAKYWSQGRDFVEETWINPDREKSFLIPDVTKEAIWRDFHADPEKNNHWELAKKYNLRADRIDAILRLKHTEKTEYPTYEPFDIVRSGDGMLYGIDYEKIMENFYLPVQNPVDKIGVDFEGRPSTYTNWKPLYGFDSEDIPDQGPGSGEIIDPADKAAANGQTPNRHPIIVSDLDEVKKTGAVKVFVRDKDGSKREAFWDEFRSAVRRERPYSKRLKKRIQAQAKLAREKGEEYVPHPSLRIID